MLPDTGCRINLTHAARVSYIQLITEISSGNFRHYFLDRVPIIL